MLYLCSSMHLVPEIMVGAIAYTEDAKLQISKSCVVHSSRSDAFNGREGNQGRIYYCRGRYTRDTLRVVNA